MPKCPIVSGHQLIKVLTKICYRIANRKGDHVILVPKCTSSSDRIRSLTVPMHRELKIGTLMTILARASLSKSEFIALINDP